MIIKTAALVALSSLAFSLPAPSVAADDDLSRVFHGRLYQWPTIGTDAYSDSCSITQWWEDGSALASCWEDGAAYRFDPEDNAWYMIN